tara:strand:+ start:270 stop:446 length:177 start_codon:yes stop_codon:yes gene_type:complete
VSDGFGGYVTVNSGTYTWPACSNAKTFTAVEEAHGTGSPTAVPPTYIKSLGVGIEVGS